MGKSGSSRDIFSMKGGKLNKMKLLSLAICSLGVWVLINSFVGAVWDDIVFGAIAAILALIAAFKE